jgi:hypothetical protein
VNFEIVKKSTPLRDGEAMFGGALLSEGLMLALLEFYGCGIGEDGGVYG